MRGRTIVIISIVVVPRLVVVITVVVITVVVIVATITITVVGIRTTTATATSAACYIAASHEVRIGALRVNIAHLGPGIVVVIVVIASCIVIAIVIVGYVVIGRNRIRVSLLSDACTGRNATVFGAAVVALLLTHCRQTGTTGLVTQGGIGVCGSATPSSSVTIYITTSTSNSNSGSSIRVGIVLSVSVHLTTRGTHSTVVPAFPVVLGTRGIIASGATTIRCTGFTKDARSGFIVGSFLVLHTLRVLAAGTALGRRRLGAGWLSLHDLHLPGSIGIGGRVGGVVQRLSLWRESGNR